MSTTYLQHHGILGQRWGVRNGPPYPLDYADHSSAEKSKNPRSRIGGGSESTKKRKKPSPAVEKAKTAAKEIGRRIYRETRADHDFDSIRIQSKLAKEEKSQAAHRRAMQLAQEKVSKNKRKKGFFYNLDKDKVSAERQMVNSSERKIASIIREAEKKGFNIETTDVKRYAVADKLKFAYIRGGVADLLFTALMTRKGAFQPSKSYHVTKPVEDKKENPKKQSVEEIMKNTDFSKVPTKSASVFGALKKSYSSIKSEKDKNKQASQNIKNQSNSAVDDYVKSHEKEFMTDVTKVMENMGGNGNNWNLLYRHADEIVKDIKKQHPNISTNDIRKQVNKSLERKFDDIYEGHTIEELEDKYLKKKQSNEKTTSNSSTNKAPSKSELTRRLQSNNESDVNIALSYLSGLAERNEISESEFNKLVGEAAKKYDIGVVESNGGRYLMVYDRKKRKH